MEDTPMSSESIKNVKTAVRAYQALQRLEGKKELRTADLSRAVISLNAEESGAYKMLTFKYDRKVSK